VTGPSWQLLVTAANVATAHVLAELLAKQGIILQLRADSALLGQAMPCALYVEKPFLQRAQRLLAEASFSDEELEFLATGVACCADAREKP
jgi:hypothetical protein